MEEATPRPARTREQLPARTPLHEATEGQSGQGPEQERPGPGAQTLLDLLRDDWA